MSSPVNMSDPTAVAAMMAEQAAQMAAVKSFNIEAFTLMVIGLMATSLRTYSRATTVGFSNFQADDYLVWVGTVGHCFETGLAFSVGEHAHGLANDAMTPEQRAALSPDSPEYQMRVLGSKIQLWGWSTYATLLWCLKASMCTFFLRLTDGLHIYKMRIYIGFGFIVASWLALGLTLLTSCRPFHEYWQINPDPGRYCHPAVSPAIVWTFLAMNVSTDLYLISIPIPLLFTANVTWRKRVALVSVFCCGLFVTAAAILRVILIVSDSKNGAFLAGSWAVRETFVAVITTNMPMLFPLFRRWMNPCLGRISSRIGTYGYRGKSTGASSRNLPPHQRAIQTVGKQRMRKQQQSLNHITNLSVTYANESEERIYELHTVGATAPAGTGVVTEIIGGEGKDDKGVVTRGHHRHHHHDDDGHGEEQDRISDLSSELSSSSPVPGIGIQRRVEIVVEEEQTDLPSGASGNFVAVSSGGGPASAGTGSGRNRSSTVESMGPGAARTSYFADHVKSENYKRI
ncbi:hypothetical protein MCOR07_010945 [Pyricularia oryzae]|nr:hypothetical protein MCOR26_001715 [Pyricularia oryzae]KAI6342479.1 hypothetical protein MCOR28_005356 [Pyricularia oryzae]KAI6447168.1 hypothetical protein MCOR22_003497 [Pyricularia oryzae]KAI6610293.1 hypothetical protein MCOR07_010945 [Pyricularia oryzae]